MKESFSSRFEQLGNYAARNRQLDEVEQGLRPKQAPWQDVAGMLSKQLDVLSDRLYQERLSRKPDRDFIQYLEAQRQKIQDAYVKTVRPHQDRAGMAAFGSEQWGKSELATVPTDLLVDPDKGYELGLETLEDEDLVVEDEAPKVNLENLWKEESRLDSRKRALEMDLEKAIERGRLRETTAELLRESIDENPRSRERLEGVEEDIVRLKRERAEHQRDLDEVNDQLSDIRMNIKFNDPTGSKRREHQSRFHPLEMKRPPEAPRRSGAMTPEQMRAFHRGVQEVENRARAKKQDAEGHMRAERENEAFLKRDRDALKDLSDLEDWN